MPLDDDNEATVGPDEVKDDDNEAAVRPGGMKDDDDDDNTALRAGGVKDNIKKKQAVGAKKPQVLDVEVIGPPAVKRFTGRSCGIIINNNYKKVKPHALPGYDKDEANILDTFGKLNVDFNVARNLKGNKMIAQISFWLETSDFEHADCAICFILTHGTDGGELYGEDLKKVNVDDIKSMFIDCKKLRGKPKLFFIQACRGEVDEQAITVDSSVKTASVVLKAKDADVFLFFPTAPGKSSWVGDKGSKFIIALCKVVRAYGSKYHLQDIVTKVNEILAYQMALKKEDGKQVIACEVSETTHSLTYNLYFNDRIPETDV